MSHPPDHGQRSWRADARSALETVSAMCPVNLSLGAFAFAALGESFAATGAIAGLLGAALSVLGTAALGYRGVGIHVPRSVTGALLGTFAAAMTVKGLPASQLAPAAFLMLMFAGVFQSCLGVVRLGSLVQYCPQPVMAGFLNAMAVLLAMSQFPHLWGLSSWEALVGALRFRAEHVTIGPPCGLGDDALDTSTAQMVSRHTSSFGWHRLGYDAGRRIAYHWLEPFTRASHWI